MCWKNCFAKTSRLAASALLISSICVAQQASPDTLSKILDRLDQLEKQNQALLSEIEALRSELKKANPQTPPESTALEEKDLEGKIDIAEQRIQEQAQTKVEASQRFPISLTGMFLFDSFLATGTKSAQFLERYEDYSLGGPGAGATLRQSIIGLDFHGPALPGGGRINGSLAMDFYAQAYNSDIFRIRRGIVSFDWTNRSIVFGQDTSIIAPLEPTSFAQVGVPPLSGAGNLWLWRPQVRYEERIPLSSATKATLQASIFETNETYSAPSLPANSPLEPSRPAVQAHVGFEHKWADESRIAVGVGGHASTTHVLGQSIPSRVISADLIAQPWKWLQVSATILHGKNFANLGGVPAGVTIQGNQIIIPIRGNAGWIQVAVPLNSRLTFDVYAGRQLNNGHDLTPFEVLNTLTYAGNVLYRLAPNVVLGFEASRSRFEYLNLALFRTDRYDATVAYLF